MSVSEVVALFRRYRFRFADEVLLQQDVATALSLHGIPFQREVACGDGYIDFVLTQERIGVECKIGQGFAAVMRQCLRYAYDEQLNGLVLVTRRAAHQSDVAELHGKPFAVCWIGGGGL